MEERGDNKRVRDESEDDSPVVKRLKEDLLGNLDESDLCTATPDLDSFMRSFEEEITASPGQVVAPAADAGSSPPELGYLLEASDDELGLPPAENDDVIESVPVASESSVELSEMWSLDEQIPSYDSFEFGLAGADYDAQDGGIVDYSSGAGADDAPMSLWMPESAPAM